MCQGQCQKTCAVPKCAPAEGNASAGNAQGITIRRMRARRDDGPISGEAVAQRMMSICGCKGQHDCSCVSLENQARVELWTEHNQSLSLEASD